MHCHSRPFPVLVPDHEIGQLSSLPYSSASYDFRDRIVLSFFFFLSVPPFSVSQYLVTETQTLHNAQSLRAQTDFKKLALANNSQAMRSLVLSCAGIRCGNHNNWTRKHASEERENESKTSRDYLGKRGNWLCLSSISIQEIPLVSKLSIWWDLFISSVS